MPYLALIQGFGAFPESGTAHLVPHQGEASGRPGGQHEAAHLCGPCNPRREIRMDHSCIDIIKYYKNIIKYYKYIWGIPQNAEIAGENGGKWIDNCFFSMVFPLILNKAM